LIARLSSDSRVADSRGARRRIVRNPVFLTLGAGILIALFSLPLLGHAPNRLVNGRSIGLEEFPAAASAILIVAALVTCAATFLPQRRSVLASVLVAGLVAPSAYLWGAGIGAEQLEHASSPIARTSLGAAGWVAFLIGYLMIGEAVRRLELAPIWRLAVLLVAIGLPALLAASGRLDDLAILKEFRSNRDLFVQSLAQHGTIVLASVVPAIVIGIPLGLVSYRSKRIRGPLLGALGLIQTIPSIALFGLLIAPLSALSEAFPWLAAIGVHGIGLAPAALALMLYALLPIVRNTVEGLAQVSPSAVDAATGMGLSRWQILARIEVPLALPVILSGVRISLVQTIGLAAVAALIGAGGLGSIMFQGLFASAGALILLGVAPIVALAIAVDILFRLLAALPRRIVA